MFTSEEFDRRIQFQRLTATDDGISQVETWASHGAAVWARRRDVSDGEKVAGGMTLGVLVSRFTVRSSSFTRGLTGKDALTCDGLTFDIDGIKEIGRQAFLEITATARTDKEGEE